MTSLPNFFMSQRANTNKFRSLLLNNPYINASLAHNKNIDNCLDFLKSQFYSCITTKYIPQCNDSKPWITPYLLNLINQRDRYHSLLKKHPHNIYVRDKFKYFKSVAEYNRKTARNRYFTSIIQKNLNNAKKLWEAFNCHIQQKKDYTKTVSIKDQNGITLTNNIDIANELNNFFTNVGAKLATDLKSLQNRAIKSTLNRYTPNSMVIRAFDCEDIVDLDL